MCAAGYGLSEDDNCAVCSPGTYSDTARANSCSNCPAGTWNQLFVSSSKSDCILCDLGKYSTDIGAVSVATCNDCGAGKYLAGKHNNETDHDEETDCKMCPKGYYGESAGLSVCSTCPSGTYQDLDGQMSPSSCRDCPKGTFGNQAGSYSEQLCLMCPTGTWSNKTGLSDTDSCTTCGAGKYNQLVGQDEEDACTECPKGKFLTDQGLDSGEHDSRDDCLDCAKGMYSALDGSSFCVECIPGKYNSLVGQDEEKACIPCPAGSHADPRVYGQTSDEACQLCKKGEYQADLNGTSGCEVCEDGKTTWPLESMVKSNSSELELEYEVNRAIWHESKDNCNVSKPGWWIIPLADEGGGSVKECPNEGCLENNKCNIGYEGDYCAMCEEGYYGASSGDCLQCKATSFAWAPLAVLFGIFMVCALVYSMNLKDIQGNVRRVGRSEATTVYYITPSIITKTLLLLASLLIAPHLRFASTFRPSHPVFGRLLRGYSLRSTTTPSCQRGRSSFPTTRLSSSWDRSTPSSTLLTTRHSKRTSIG